MSPLEQLVIANGFTSLDEFQRLIASVDLTSPDHIIAFKKWQLNDGSKTGLLALLVPSTTEQNHDKTNPTQPTI